MRPKDFFTLACVFFGAAVGCIEAGVRAYVNDDKWDKALAEETPNGSPAISE